jgi:hypothetical protein
MCVGELFLGVELRPSFLENVRVRLVFSGTGWVVMGGDTMSGWYISGLMEVFW